MAVYIWCEIACENCSKTSQGMHVNGAIPRRELKKVARLDGFLFVGDLAYCSEECRKIDEERDREFEPL